MLEHPKTHQCTADVQESFVSRGQSVMPVVLAGANGGPFSAQGCWMAPPQHVALCASSIRSNSSTNNENSTSLLVCNILWENTCTHVFCNWSVSSGKKRDLPIESCSFRPLHSQTRSLKAHHPSLAWSFPPLLCFIAVIMFQALALRFKTSQRRAIARNKKPQTLNIDDHPASHRNKGAPTETIAQKKKEKASLDV